MGTIYNVNFCIRKRMDYNVYSYLLCLHKLALEVYTRNQHKTLPTVHGSKRNGLNGNLVRARLLNVCLMKLFWFLNTGMYELIKHFNLINLI